MGPESLCFLFAPAGQSVACWEGSLGAGAGAVPRAGGSAELWWGQLTVPYSLSGQRCVMPADMWGGS